MSDGYLLDTNICIYLLKRKYDVDKKLDSLSESRFYVSEITLAELYYGASKSVKKEAMLKEVEFISSLFTVLPISDSLDLYADNKVQLERMGMPIDDFDLLIGSTAIRHNLVVVTENIKHLGRIPQVKVENWIVRE